MSCPTCQLIKGILLAQGVPIPAVDAFGVLTDPTINRLEDKAVRVVKRKASAYSKKYARAFKKIQNKYKTKSGKWAKNGYKRAVKEAHRLAKRMK